MRAYKMKYCAIPKFIILFIIRLPMMSFAKCEVRIIVLFFQSCSEPIKPEKEIVFDSKQTSGTKELINAQA